MQLRRVQFSVEDQAVQNAVLLNLGEEIIVTVRGGRHHLATLQGHGKMFLNKRTEWFWAVVACGEKCDQHTTEERFAFPIRWRADSGGWQPAATLESMSPITVLEANESCVAQEVLQTVLPHARLVL